MRNLVVLVAACLLLSSCERKSTVRTLQVWECRPNGGPWDGNGKVYDFDKLEDDLDDAQHKAACVKAVKDDQIHFKSSPGNGRGHHGPFNLYVIAESGDAECDVSKVFDWDKTCQSKVDVKILQPVSKGCSYEVYPLFACTPGLQGTQKGADPHIELTP